MEKQLFKNILCLPVLCGNLKLTVSIFICITAATFLIAHHLLKILEKCLFKVLTKNTTTEPFTSFCCFHCKFWINVTYCLTFFECNFKSIFKVKKLPVQPKLFHKINLTYNFIRRMQQKQLPRVFKKIDFQNVNIEICFKYSCRHKFVLVFL